MEIDILGSTYTINFLEELPDKDGLCNYSTREIKICSTILKKCLDGVEGFETEFLFSVLRHEIIHAFHGESGLCNYGNINTEGIVDWMAIQFHKIKNAIESAEKQVYKKHLKVGGEDVTESDS